MIPIFFMSVSVFHYLFALKDFSKLTILKIKNFYNVVRNIHQKLWKVKALQEFYVQDMQNILC